MGISVWLVPSGQDALKLKNLMRAGIGNSHSAPSYPTFESHLTIISVPLSHNIPLSTIRTAIPTSQGPVAIEFESISIGESFFQSVYVAVKPTADLVAFHDHIHTALGLEPKAAVSFPHISLCYVDEEDARNGERRRFLQKLEGAGRVAKEIGRVGLRDAGGDREEGWLWGFEASEAWIVNCVGPINGWNVLAKVPLIQAAPGQ